MRRRVMIIAVMAILGLVLSTAQVCLGSEEDDLFTPFLGRWIGRWDITSSSSSAHRDLSITIEKTNVGYQVFYKVGSYANNTRRGSPGYEEMCVPRIEIKEGVSVLRFTIDHKDKGQSIPLKFVIEKGRLVGSLANVRDFDWACDLTRQ